MPAISPARTDIQAAKKLKRTAVATPGAAAGKITRSHSRQPLLPRLRALVIRPPGAPVSHRVPSKTHAAISPPKERQPQARRRAGPSDEGGAGPRQILRLEARPTSGPA